MCLPRPGLRCHEHSVGGFEKANAQKQAAIDAGKPVSAYIENRVTYWKRQISLTPEAIAHNRVVADNLEKSGKTKEAAHLRMQCDAREAHATRCNALATPSAVALRASGPVTAERMADVSTAGMDSNADTSTAARAHVAATSTNAEQLLSLARHDKSLAVMDALQSNPAAGAEVRELVEERKAVLQARGKDRALATKARRARARQADSTEVAPVVAHTATKVVKHVQGPSVLESEYDTADRARYEEDASEQLKLTRHHSVEVRMALADSKVATPATLQILANSSNRSVSRFARNNKNYEG